MTKRYAQDDYQTHKPYKCSTCGLTATSKNASTRTVFPDEDKIIAWSISSWVYVQTWEERPNDLSIEITLDQKDLKRTLSRFIHHLRGIPEEDLGIAICSITERHTWEPNGWEWGGEGR